MQTSDLLGNFLTLIINEGIFGFVTNTKFSFNY